MGWKLLYELFLRARKERSSPREVGASIAVGVFAGCTPLLGLHMWIALAAATLLRLNRLWAFLGSRMPFLLAFMWISFSEIEVGHRLRTGVWAAVSPSFALEQARLVVHGSGWAATALSDGRGLLYDWFLGLSIVGTAIAAFIGFLAYLAALRWERRSALRPRTLDAPRRPSSESRPSTPPATSP
jgi:uncharacterized protein (DUF2062 family)